MKQLKPQLVNAFQKYLDVKGRGDKAALNDCIASATVIIDSYMRRPPLSNQALKAKATYEQIAASALSQSEAFNDPHVFVLGYVEAAGLGLDEEFYKALEGLNVIADVAKATLERGFTKVRLEKLARDELVFAIADICERVTGQAVRRFRNPRKDASSDASAFTTLCLELFKIYDLKPRLSSSSTVDSILKGRSKDLRKKSPE